MVEDRRLFERVRAHRWWRSVAPVVLIAAGVVLLVVLVACAPSAVRCPPETCVVVEYAP